MNLSPGTALGTNGPGQPVHSPLMFSDGKVQPLDSPLVSADGGHSHGKDGNSKREEDGEDADLVETKFLL